MLLWICRLTHIDKIMNEHIRGTRVVSKKILYTTEMVWACDEKISPKVLRTDEARKRKKRRPKTRWKDACQQDPKSRSSEETDKLPAANQDDRRSQCKRRCRSLLYLPLVPVPFGGITTKLKYVVNEANLVTLDFFINTLATLPAFPIYAGYMTT